MQKRALVRRPGPRLSEGLLTHLERSPVDADLARRQWLSYAAAMQSEGWELYEVGQAVGNVRNNDPSLVEPLSSEQLF